MKELVRMLNNIQYDDFFTRSPSPRVIHAIDECLRKKYVMIVQKEENKFQMLGYEHKLIKDHYDFDGTCYVEVGNEYKTNLPFEKFTIKKGTNCFQKESFFPCQIKIMKPSITFLFKTNGK